MNSSLTVYKASAGSGKTFTLAVQYIKLLIAEEGMQPAYSHILAVTFTNKATAEMKDRIIQQLYGIWKGLDSSQGYMQKLREELHHDGIQLTDDEIQRRAGYALSRILHDYSRFRIETIDSFFQSVMRNLAHELSLTANLKVDLDNKTVLEMAVDRVLERLHLHPVVMNWILEYVNDRIANNERWDIAREVKGFAGWIFNEAYITEEPELRRVLKENKEIGQLRRALDQEMRQAVDIVQSGAGNFRDELESYGITCETFCRGGSLDTYLRKMENGDFSADFGTTLQKYVESPENMLKKSDRSRPDLMEAACHFNELLADLRQLHQQGTIRYNSASLSLKYLNPLRLLDVISEEVTALNHENNSFLLAQTPILLNGLIEENDAPFIFEKMGTVFHHVMIDEFQDTSALQWRNFKLLLQENIASGFGNLIVGDIKQSIYRWRNGDWKILKDIGNEAGLNRPEIRSLTTNYRSERRIIGFNNALFENAAKEIDMIAPDADIKIADAYHDVKQSCPDNKPDKGYVRIRFYNEKDKDTDPEELMLDELCEQASLLHKAGTAYEDMAILVRKRKHTTPIVRKFAEKLPDVKLVSDEAFLLSNSTSVNMLVNAMRHLINPEDRIATAFLILNRTDAPHGQRCVGELTGDTTETLLPDELLNRREELKSMPLYELQEELFRIFRLDRVTDQDAYLFAYFDHITTYLQDNPSDITSFLNYWDETLSAQSIPSGEISGIRIFTIHKSKGLQFHTVFIPYCDWDIEKDSTGFARHNDLLWCRPDRSPYNMLPLLPIHIEGRMRDSIYSKEYAEEHLQRRVDALNTLYVAFTRAEKNLFAWCGTKYALDERSGIGDAVYRALPDFDGQVKTEEDGNGQTSLYEYGSAVAENKTKSHRNDNRMEIIYTPRKVHMHSYKARIEFRQSNKAKDFIDSMAGTEDSASRQDGKRRTGILLHKIFSTIYTRDDIPKALLRLETEGLVATLPEKEKLTKKVEAAFTLPEVTRWFDGSMKLYNECPILTQEYNEENSKYRSYRPDRVMFGNDCIIVVDFKFGAHNEKYKEQVAGYMRQLRLMEPDKTVKGYLWYILGNKLEEVED